VEDDLGERRFAAEHGITEEVFMGRPYVRWTRDDVQPVRDGYAGLNRYQRAFMVRLARQSDGRVITRHAPPDMEVAHVYPEVRPDNAVRTHPPRRHWHGEGEPPAGCVIRREGWRAWLERESDGAFVCRVLTGKPVSKHVNQTKFADSHHGIHSEDVHLHDDRAKYCFPPAPPKQITKFHRHDAFRPDVRRAHVERRHDGLEGPGLHEHEYRVKDRTVNYAARIDLHPMAVDLIPRADVVFFIIEGCLKADAVLSQGAAVFSVPSVTLWACAELEDFVTAYLREKVIVIIPDADWALKFQVESQARICAATLLRHGVAAAHIAAPPIDQDGNPLRDANGNELKGIDDFLAAGGQLDDLMTLDRLLPDGIDEFLAGRGRADKLRRDAMVMQSMALWAGSQGTISLPLRTIAKVLGVHHSRVTRAVHDLLEYGAITIDGSLEQRRNHFTGHMDWRHTPTITIRPELRAPNRPAERLGDVIEGDLLPAQHITPAA
jgi:hypothetical protein